MSATTGSKTCFSKTFLVLNAVGIILTLSSSTVLTPLWIDSVGIPKRNVSNNTTHLTSNNASDFQHVDGFSMVLTVNVVFTVCSGIIVIIIKLCLKDVFSEADYSFPKSQFFWIGMCDSLSSICFVYASSGTRTAPYLQALMINFALPVTFIIRYLLLRKRPTLKKMLCAVVVLIAEFVALIPNIFPSVEGTASKKEDGGASGIGGILWPLCYALGYIPQAVMNTVIEKSTKKTSTAPSGGHVHSLYLMFWNFFFCFVCVTFLFWTDFLPAFGMTNSIENFAKVLWFNVKCVVGADECSNRVIIFAWSCMSAMFFNRILTITFLRFSEGANYLVVIQSLQIPLTQLFWMLFDENPLHWNPHIHLSTWLSIGATVVMLPSIYIYNTGGEEVSSEVPQHGNIRHNSDDIDEIQPLFDSTVNYESIQADCLVYEDWRPAYQNSPKVISKQKTHRKKLS